MRVALINNMNNNFFAFARYLRDLGVDAHLFIIDPLPQHFLPEADTFEDLKSLTYVHYLDGGAIKCLRPIRMIKFIRQLKRFYIDLKKFDLIVACGDLSYFALKNIKIDVFMPYGGDAFQRVWQHKLSGRSGLVYLYHCVLAKLQRKAIQNTRTVITLGSIDGNISEALQQLSKTWLEGGIPMVYPLQMPKFSLEWEFLRQHDFIVFSHTRQSWENVWDYKGNEKYIAAFSRFVKNESIFKSPILVLFEYGDTVEASKRLIKELEIEQYVCWMPRMFRKNIFYGLSRASMAIDALTNTVASFGGVVFESMLQGLPVIGTATIPNSNPITHLPLVDAYTEEDVYQIFLDYQNDPEKYKKIGKNSKKWFEENIGLNKVTKYKKLFELLVDEPSLTSDSPGFQQKVSAIMK